MSISWPALNFDLGADIDLLRDTVAAFCAAEIAPRLAERPRGRERTGGLPDRLQLGGERRLVAEEEAAGAFGPAQAAGRLAARRGYLGATGVSAALFLLAFPAVSRWRAAKAG